MDGRRRRFQQRHRIRPTRQLVRPYVSGPAAQLLGIDRFARPLMCPGGHSSERSRSSNAPRIRWSASRGSQSFHSTVRTLAASSPLALRSFPPTSHTEHAACPGPPRNSRPSTRRPVLGPAGRYSIVAVCESCRPEVPSEPARHSVPTESTKGQAAAQAVTVVDDRCCCHVIAAVAATMTPAPSHCRVSRRSPTR
jgi:hypothetical protein